MMISVPSMSGMVCISAASCSCSEAQNAASEACSMLRRRGSARTLKRRDRNQITGIEIVEDQLFRVRDAQWMGADRPAYGRETVSRSWNRFFDSPASRDR